MLKSYRVFYEGGDGVKMKNVLRNTCMALRYYFKVLELLTVLPIQLLYSMCSLKELSLNHCVRRRRNYRLMDE